MVKNPFANAGDIRDAGSIPGSERAPGRKWQPTPVFLPGESHGQRSLVVYSPWGLKETQLKRLSRLTCKELRNVLSLEKIFSHQEANLVVYFSFSVWCRGFMRGSSAH